MQRFAIKALMAGGALALSVQSSFALPNEVIVGFHSDSAGSDYLINLGDISTIGIGGATATDLSIYYNAATFNSTFGGSATGVSFGAGGGQSGIGSNLHTYLTQARAGGPGNAADPGSTQPSLTDSNSSSVAGSFGSVINASGLSAGTDGTLATSDSGGWTANVVGPGSNVVLKGLDVTSAISGNVAYADLWAKDGAGSQFTYEGYLTFDYGNNTLGFTPMTAVPEPSTYALLAIGGLFLIALQRKRNHPARNV